MFSYKIIKKGRKWFQAEEAEKGFKAQIEINELSKDWIEGQVIQFEGRFEKQISGGYTKVYIYPCTQEQKEEHKEAVAREKEQKEIEKWLGYVEKNATEYVYQNGVEKLRGMNLNNKQKARLKAAIQKGTINSSKKRIRDYFRYIKNSVSEGRWYEKGETVILEELEILKKYCEDTTEYEGKLAALKAEYVEIKEQKEIEDAKRYFTIQTVSEYKGDGYKGGEIVRFCDGRLGKVVKVWRYYEEDTLSLGYLCDGGWLIFAKCDTYAVTEEEKKQFEEKERAYEEEKELRKRISEKKKEIRNTVNELACHIMENGECPEGKGILVDGEILYDTFDIYGAGQRIVINGSFVWILRNNGADGDDWSLNNIRTGGAGAIGHKMQVNYTCKVYIEKIKQLKEELKHLESLQ